MALRAALCELDFATPLSESGVTRRRGAWLTKGEGFGWIGPWEQLGEAPVEFHLKEYGAGRVSSLLARSLDMMRWGSRAESPLRAQKAQSPHQPDTLIETAHLLWSLGKMDPTQLTAFSPCRDGSRVFKIKVSPRMDPKSVNQLFGNPGFVCRLRLDANNQFASAKSFLEFYDQLLPRVQDSVEFIEEPTAYSLNEWETLARQGLRLALDRELSSYKSGDESVTHFVVKPLVHDAGVWAERAALEMKRVVVSHNMDPDLAFQYCVGVQQELSQKHPLLLDVPGLGAWHQGVLAGIGAEPEDPKLVWSEL